MLSRTLIFVAAAVGTALATLGMEQWVAVTAATSTVVSRAMQNTRLEERKVAYSKAASLLNSTAIKWEALPAEHKARQDRIDWLVNTVEQAIEATLPPTKPAAGGGESGGGGGQ